MTFGCGGTGAGTGVGMAGRTAAEGGAEGVLPGGGVVGDEHAIATTERETTESRMHGSISERRQSSLPKSSGSI